MYVVSRYLQTELCSGSGFAVDPDDIHVFSSFFYTKLRQRGYNEVKRWTTSCDVFKKSALIVPINEG